jgi:hypothetical protein
MSSSEVKSYWTKESKGVEPEELKYTTTTTTTTTTTNSIQFNSILYYLCVETTARIIIIIIQFNSIHVYLRANLTAQMPITTLARERRKRQQTKNLQKM